MVLKCKEKHSGLRDSERQMEVFNSPLWPKILQNTYKVFVLAVVPCCAKVLTQVKALRLSLFCGGRHMRLRRWLNGFSGTL